MPKKLPGEDLRTVLKSVGPTSFDVARHAGVSRTTVSMVINGNADSISEQTRKRVLASVAELNYVPDRNAQALRSNRSDVVLAPLPDFHDADSIGLFFTTLRARLQELDLRLVMDTDLRLSGAEGARRWLEHRPQVVFSTPARCDRRAVEVLKAGGVSGVVLLAPHPVRYAPTLTFSDGLGVVAAEHLLKLGHRNLTYMAPAISGSKEFSDIRYGEFLETIDSHRTRGVNIDADFVEVELNTDSISRVVLEWINSRTIPSAVFCYNDEYALALTQVLQDAGLSVPGDVSIIGCDNSTLGSILRPTLSTAQFDLEAVAEYAAHNIHRIAQGKPLQRGRNTALRATVIERESTRKVTE